MDFPDGTHLWLRNRVRDAYLHADEDGKGISLTTNRATLNAAWQVHLIERHGVSYILLRCAAYGRYLAVSESSATDGRRGRDVAQTNFSEPEQMNLRWRGLLAGDGTGDFLLWNDFQSDQHFLRANGRYNRWDNGVTAGLFGSGSTMMAWTAVRIPLRAAPPALPLPSRDLGLHTAMFQRLTGPVVDRQRTISYMAGIDEDNYLSSGTFKFLGRSVFNLRTDVARYAGMDVLTVAMGVYAGAYGRITPMVMDLPQSEDPLEIVVLPHNSPVAMGFRHPYVEAPDPVMTLSDDLVAQLLFRLPPENPENLMHTALVCNQWARLVSRPNFRRQLHSFHGSGGPPILGYFCDTTHVSSRFGDGSVICRFFCDGIFNLVPVDRRSPRKNCRVLGSHRGRVLWCPMKQRFQAFPDVLWVCCPICGEEILLPQVPRRPTRCWSAALICHPTADDGVEPMPWEPLPACHREPFQVVLVGFDDAGLFSCIFSSDSVSGHGSWSYPVQAELAPPLPPGWFHDMASAQVGNMIWFMLRTRDRMVSYDMTGHSFVVVETPGCSHNRAVPVALEDGRVGIAAVINMQLRMWARPVEGDGVWTEIIDAIPLDGMLPVPDQAIEPGHKLVGSADTGVLFLWTPAKMYRINFRTRQVKTDELNFKGANVFSVVPFQAYLIPAWRAYQKTQRRFWAARLLTER